MTGNSDTGFAAVSKPTFGEAFKFWLKLGFISFGGPAGQIAIMHEYLVDNKKWISNSKFMHALNYCMLLPGPEAQQLAIYTGWLLHGNKGGLAAGILFILPSMFILLGLSIIYVSFSNVPVVYALFSGLKPAVISIVILALIKIAGKSLNSFFHYFIAVSAFICIFFFNVSFPLIISGAVLITLISKKFFPRVLSSMEYNSVQKDMNENEYFINSDSQIPGTGFNPSVFLRQILVFIILWTVPFFMYKFFLSDFTFWKDLSLFFTKAAFVTFGGAYAVLPYVAQVSVESFNWLTNLQMLDGLALGETTPGPLIMVLAFTGFMAGYNHYGSSLIMGTLGLAATTFYTFLPGFLFIFLGAPLIEKTHGNIRVRELMEIVTAAVTGVILNLTVYLSIPVLFHGDITVRGIDYFSLIWIIISFAALYRYKINMIAWLSVSALCGILNYLITL